MNLWIFGELKMRIIIKPDMVCSPRFGKPCNAESKDIARLRIENNSYIIYIRLVLLTDNINFTEIIIKTCTHVDMVF